MSFLKNFIKKVMGKVINLKAYNLKINDLKILTSQALVRDNKNSNFSNIQDAEFKVFSQWGEDGIIQYLVNKLPIKNKVFIEFGVEDYSEANTRFLLENDNWSGLVMDGSLKNIEQIKNNPIHWKYDLFAKDVFITKDNINSTIENYIKTYSFDKEIGLLSIDIDGNDYYVWEAIDSINPVIVICEYNSIFGNKHSITVPYDDEFVRTQKHYSNLYFGASIQAFYKLAKSKGYEFIGTNKNSVNAFFVKKEYANKYIPELITTPEDNVVESKFRESRDETGNLTFLRTDERIKLIKSMPVINLDNNQLVTLHKLFK
ncbi:MAG: hypothetical protein JKX75_01850 [Gammaproteobacteria bacterium]|nr:hypothetical protein [Gammaproteobacteria bacterium]